MRFAKLFELWDPLNLAYLHKPTKSEKVVTAFLEHVYKKRHKKLSDRELLNKAHALAAYLGVTTMVGNPGQRGTRTEFSKPIPMGLAPKVGRHWDTKTLYAPHRRGTKKEKQPRETAEILVHELAHYQTSGKLRKEPDWGLGPVDDYMYGVNVQKLRPQVSYQGADYYEGVSSLLMACYFVYFGDYAMAYYVLNNYGLLQKEEFIKDWEFLVGKGLINGKTGQPILHKKPKLV